MEFLHFIIIQGTTLMEHILFEYLVVVKWRNPCLNTFVLSYLVVEFTINIIDTHLMILGIVDLVKWPDRKVSSYKDIRICLRSNNEDLFCKSGDLLSEKFYILSFIAVVFVLDMFLKSQLTMVMTIMSEMDLSIK